ncbi:MAG: hypothetical protein IJ644_04095 [Oscillospiraceae bacterium]|nr:hypothetical protein [Oscillospiraceae bacterium]
MEQILSQQNIAEKIALNFQNQVIFFPVRHHSPVCSYQLRKTIEACQPEIILIEGPENANDLISVLTDEKTVLPCAIYYFYKDKKKYISEDAEDYHCYYPFLNASPEFTAMKEAKKRNIPAKFIDLPYSEILINSRNYQQNYADDSYLVKSRFYQKLCEKTNLRSFDEFWEKYFEIAGLRLSPEDFIRQMYTYCILTRQDASKEELDSDGCTAREQHMAFRIQETMQNYQKILVVTGGFHSWGLSELLKSKIKPVKLHKFTEEIQNCYPIAYSYQAADALRGYASGMMHPYFYDKISEALETADSPEGIYHQQALDFLTKTAKESAKKDIAVSISDITSAYSLMEGLAALRNSPEAGIFEIYDGVTGAFIKGEKTAASSLPLEILSKLATGEAVGHIGDKNHVPPLISDFENQCKKFRLKANTAVPQEAEISLFTSEKELEKSRFFHQMEFLQTEFCKMTKGADLHANKDRSRVRELWRYCRSPQTDAALVDHTTDGSTLGEACKTVASKMIHQEHRCEIIAHVSVDCFLMGVTLSDADIFLMEQILANDGDFFSLGNGLYYFDMLHELRNLYDFADPSNLKYMEQCFTKLIALLPSMGTVQPEQAQECIKICKLLYNVSGRVFPERQNEFKSALLTLSEREQKEPSVYGAAMGLLYALDGNYLQSAENAMQGYLTGSPAMKKQGASYLKGLFETARDIALMDKNFLAMTDSLLSDMEYDDFMEILPSLRLAYGYFTPFEIQEISGEVSEFHGLKEDLTSQTGLDEALVAFGAELDAEIFRELRENCPV